MSFLKDKFLSASSDAAKFLEMGAKIVLLVGSTYLMTKSFEFKTNIEKLNGENIELKGLEKIDKMVKTIQLTEYHANLKVNGKTDDYEVDEKLFSELSKIPKDSKLKIYGEKFNTGFGLKNNIRADSIKNEKGQWTRMIINERQHSLNNIEPGR